MTKTEWTRLLSLTRDWYGLQRLCQRHAWMFSADDRRWLRAAGVDFWPRAYRLLRQELRAQRGQDHIMEPRNGDPANAAFRRIWRPAAIFRR